MAECAIGRDENVRLVGEAPHRAVWLRDGAEGSINADGASVGVYGRIWEFELGTDPPGCGEIGHEGLSISHLNNLGRQSFCALHISPY